MCKFMKSAKAVAATFLAFVIAGTYSINANAAIKEEKITISLLGKYDSSDTAAIRSIDTENKEIRFRNHSTGKTYTLKYDNTSMMYDLRGTPMSARLLEEGQIVDVNFLKSSKHITSLKVSDEAWTIDDTRNHELVRGDGTARILGEMYRIDTRTLILADGAPAIAEDILTTDNIKAYGIGKEIYSIVVTSGHGYVSLSSDTVEDHSLVGAWLELDNDVIYKISPNMLLSAPEGDYNLQILGNGAEYQATVNISRNTETVVDTGKVTITKPKEGLVTFEVTPEDAEVYVDGEKMLTGTSQFVGYGYHNLKIMAEGYITQHKYLKVGTAKSVVKIELEPESDDQDSSKSSMSDSSAFSLSDDKANKSSASVSVATLPGKSASATSASSSEDKNKAKTRTNKVIEGHKIYVDDPSGVELFFDGNYIGVTPVSLPKVSGSHEIILKKDGYKTKSFRVNIDSDETDVNYGFNDLVKEEKETEYRPKAEENPSNASTASPAPANTTAPSTSASTTEPSVSAATSDTSSAKDTSSTTASTEEEDKKKPVSDGKDKELTKEEEETPGKNGVNTGKEDTYNKDKDPKDKEGKDKENSTGKKDKTNTTNDNDAANTASGEE